MYGLVGWDGMGWGYIWWKVSRYSVPVLAPFPSIMVTAIWNLRNTTLYFCILLKHLRPLFLLNSLKHYLLCIAPYCILRCLCCPCSRWQTAPGDRWKFCKRCLVDHSCVTKKKVDKSNREIERKKKKWVEGSIFSWNFSLSSFIFIIVHFWRKPFFSIMKTDDDDNSLPLFASFWL